MAFNVPARLDKLSLVHRKNIRDEFEAKKGDLQTRVATAIGFDTFDFNFDANQVLAYAASHQSTPGSDIFRYFETFTTIIEEYTKKGTDAEAKDALQKVLAKKEATLAAATEADGINYCGCKFRDQKAYLLFHPSQYGSWQGSLGDNFAREMDIAIDSLNDGDLPISTKRAITNSLEPRLKKASDKFQEMFGKPITLGYNVKETLDYLKKPDTRKKCMHINDNDLPARVPEAIGEYFEKAAEGLEKANFGKDDMMQEAFLESAEKGVMFEVLDELKNGQRYNDCLFEDGWFKLQTVPGEFGSWIGSIVDHAADRL